MKKIAITQRILTYGGLNESHDALAHGWSALFATLPVALFPMPNGGDIGRWLAAIAPDGVILTGGNDIAVVRANAASWQRDAAETALVDYAAAQRLPLFAVCRGMQFLATRSGGALKTLEGHVGKRHTLTPKATSPYFTDPGLVMEVNSYHHYAVTSLPPEYTGLAAADDGTWEAMAHKTMPWLAQMWHPEREEKVPAWQRQALITLFGL